MKLFTSKTQKLGQIGENIACKYLRNKGFIIIERNFTLRCGEIDIIANKGEEIRFIEVKTVKYRGEGSFFRPEDNMHFNKLQRIIRTCLVYADMKKFGDHTPWQVDVLAIEYDAEIKRAYIRHLESIY
jgi:putative endonuclease